MCFSSAFVLAVVAALASSSVFAIPPQVDEAGTTQCRNFCYIDEDCQEFGCTHRTCLFNWFCVEFELYKNKLEFNSKYRTGDERNATPHEPVTIPVSLFITYPINNQSLNIHLLVPQEFSPGVVHRYNGLFYATQIVEAHTGAHVTMKVNKAPGSSRAVVSLFTE
ncbi:uncharacterized protein F5891DRAFT_983518 [Suillus fuscotomentosus]|uniref:Uncharacterized protein n=1 Tax=Suillus fuscotomentosus TaxID=1912939 RepID=A0AAD4DYA3_9AGAM|nr:uncharacterized protein F5891DRAFT_983518 [Suillus fuscotomentosus]KAG1896331.1 hypothetical protein F5891DRAFT_983518 [Suillus fuscotomentosus]